MDWAYEWALSNCLHSEYQLAICSLFKPDYNVNDLKTPLCQAEIIQNIRYHQAGLVNLLWAAPLYWKRSSDIRKVLSRNFRGEKWWYHTHNNGKRIGKLFDTLSAHQYEGNVLDISILGHLGIVIVDGVEWGLVFQTEHEYHGVHPRGKLKSEWGLKW